MLLGFQFIRCIERVALLYLSGGKKVVYSRSGICTYRSLLCQLAGNMYTQPCSAGPRHHRTREYSVDGAMQIYMCHQVQPCAHSPPPLQLFGSANTDAARVATLGGLLQSALQKMTASIMIWLQNPSEAVPARSLPNPVSQSSSTQPGAGDTACPLMATSHECALNDANCL